MFARARSFRPSGAMAVALVALFFSVGGLGYAKQALKLIDGHQIKLGTIEANRLSRVAQAALRGRPGAQGLQGPKGDQGLQGAQGPPGLSTGPAGGDLAGNYPNPSIAAAAVTDAKVAAANKDGAATVPSLRTLGFGALQAMPGNATPGGPPTGPAGGALTGSYPNPSLAAGSVDTSNFASGATAPNALKLGGNAASAFWQLAGNSGTNPASDFLGTSDSQPLTLKVGGQRALLLQPTAGSPDLIGGASGNTVSSGVQGATIGGGGQNGPGTNNSVTDHFGTVAGGYGNSAGNYSTASGQSNNASGPASTALGVSNTASGGASTALGNLNTASGSASTASGLFNMASGNYSSALGRSNLASGSDATASGQSNTASGSASTASGHSNNATGGASTALGDSNTAGGSASTALGLASVANGSYSTAIGYHDSAPGLTAFAIGGGSSSGGANSFAGGNSGIVSSGHDNTFLWSDGATSGGSFTSTGANQFDVRATNGVEFQTNAGATYTTGCTLPAGGGAWACTSDRHAKRAFAPISLQQVLRKIASLWISTWSYKTDPSHTRHIGPVAQDFKSAFGVGSDPRSIGLLDEGGVALAGVKGLYQLVQQQQALLGRQQAEITSLQAQVRSLQTH